MATTNERTGHVANERDINIISLDLGTRNLIVRVNQKVVFSQPSAIVFDTENGQVFIGTEALGMKEKTPHNKIFKEPMANGVISDSNALIAMLTEIFTNIIDAESEKIWENSVALVAIPSKVYKLDRTVLKEIIEGKKVAKITHYSDKFPKRYTPENSKKALAADKVVIVPEVKLAAIGAGLPIWDATGVFLLDIGGGTSDCAVLSSGEVIVQDSISTAGNAIEAELKKYFENMHFLNVSSEEAEKAKMQAGIWIEEEKNNQGKITVHGKSTKTKTPEKIIVSKQEVAKEIAKAYEPIVQLCQKIIEQTASSFSKMLLERGLVVTGGGALTENICHYLKKALNLEHVTAAQDPKSCVIKGTQSYETHKQDLYDLGYIRPSK